MAASLVNKSSLLLMQPVRLLLCPQRFRPRLLRQNSNCEIETLRTISTQRCVYRASKDGESGSPDQLSPPLDTALESDLENRNKLSASEDALDKFGKIVERLKKAQDTDANEDSKLAVTQDPNESFASMFRRSKFVSLGEHKDRLVQGEIFEIMEDNLFIDFGGKFHCVCPRPKRNGERYQRGTKVLLSLQCMEMSSSFLGSDVHVTLLEADATLLGVSAASKSTQTQEKNS